MSTSKPDNLAGPRILKVDSSSDGQRLDNYLLRELKSLPRSRLYKLLRKGEIRVNKRRVRADYRVNFGDQVRLPPMRLATAKPPVIAGQKLLDDLRKRILYEDSELLVVNKPAGLSVHGGSGISLGLIEAMRMLGNNYASLELAHRLDRETSGCLLLARKRSALRGIHRQFREQEVRKDYLALVHGRWPSAQYKIDAPLLKTSRPDGEKIVRVHIDGSPSVTHFDVVEKFTAATLVAARPQTGRTHQIRVHAAHAGHPLFGDDRYGDRVQNRATRDRGLKRLFLHAKALRFKGGDGVDIEVESPLDINLISFLESIRN